METLASMWEHEHDPADLCDLDESRNMLSSLWESQCAFTPPAGQMWTQQLSPHLQRNKLLQDALLQREEELARLQEENNKLRGFLSSSFVTNLQEKAKKLTADRRSLKRNQSSFDHEPSEVRGRPFAKQVTKRVCRNLTAEFCSESSAGSASPEPNLDLWVLRMLGLKDQNTIDTSSESESSLRGLVFGDAFGSPVSTSSSVHSYRQTAAGETDHPSSEGAFPARPAPTCSEPVGTSPGSALTEICSTRGVQPLESSWTPTEPLCFTSRSSSCAGLNKSQAPSGGCSATSSQPLHKPTDLAFSMSLSPSSSVKTHSFPQGQAFIRKDTGGRWNFTWVPRQEP
ncbi:geminin coiled-coil domain-containing protein 1 [Gambusia affinis]|uniref:geminin coiled-coil domain-containing protein 1 n=1 Tax=Gambusia affinis TaxID=33528 RepID=UPI001CDC9661|nr:geminin coiled-coil domain-containing protein 1 [Gambusia affinis]XP_043975744.1 geminin coiled-coil domain-containing protein 1 [Gambusia affinis]XP_043975745.1 geminin coiled-coil domain-containing protein 1 [Gambusia affinis]XP_043975746.1 geminin coiled-coil domain-containing protein 1 [Gambusia affinis]XP_043975747.1 geminin coiled-coil domain-containing protein 1 [Gambusia affinis]